MNHGFIKVAAAVPRVQVADCTHNIKQIESLMRRASERQVQILVFPEMSITAYTCLDLFAQHTLLQEAEKALLQLVEQTQEMDIFTVAGLPLVAGNCLINAAVAFQKGRILGVVPKAYLSNQKEFQEERWFTPAPELTDDMIRIGERSYPMSHLAVFTSEAVSIGVEIGEDLWTPVPASTRLAMSGAQVILNLSASPELAGKHTCRRALVAQQSGRCMAGYVYASCGYGESTTDMVFAGSCLIAENGVILRESERFSMEEQLIVGEIDIDHIRHDRLVNNNFMKGAPGFLPEDTPRIAFTLPPVTGSFTLTRTIDPSPFIPPGDALATHCEDVFRIQAAGLAKRIEHTHARTAVIGISGGLDSTLALLVTVAAFDLLRMPRSQILGITMPGFGTTDRTHTNAVSLIRLLGATCREISIREACLQHLRDIGHDIHAHDVTYENTQARERTQLLMDIANRENGLVIGTGNLSELALGWTTYNGDHMSMYGVNAGVPKTLVRRLVEWVANHRVDDISRLTLLDIIDTPVSPELIPAASDGTIVQKTEDLVGPYELHDFFLYHFLRFGARPAKIDYLARIAFAGAYEPVVIRKWLHVFFSRFFRQQFKRNCLPDGPKAGTIGLSPRGDWRMPSDAVAALWLKEIETLPEV